MLRPPPKSTLFPYTTLFRPAQSREVRCRIGIEACEAPAHEVGPELAFELPKGPPLQMLKNTAAQEPVRRNARASGAGRIGPASGKPLADHVYELGIIEQ